MARFIPVFFLLYGIQYFMYADSIHWRMTFKIKKDGTDDDVSITLVGTSKSVQVTMKCKDECDKDTERKFYFSTDEIGTVEDVQLKVTKTNKWALDMITLENLNTSEAGHCNLKADSVLYYNCSINMIKSTTLKNAVLASTSPAMASTITQAILQTVTTCYSGWVDIEDLCYRIINQKEDMNDAKHSCKYDAFLSTKIPDDLTDIIGYDETVWMNIGGNVKACPMNNQSRCATSGKFNSLCSRPVINVPLTLSGPVSFFDASWLISNTKISFDIIKHHYLNCCVSEGIWTGMYIETNKLMWIGGSFVSESEVSLLNVQNATTLLGFQRKCAMYNGSITFIECSETKMGLRSPFPPSHSSAVTQIPVTAQMPLTFEQQSTTRSQCFCPCPKNISAEEFKESLKEIVINKKDTSNYKRSKISAPDKRTSSKTIGMVAVAVTVVPFSLLILSDAPTLVFQVIATYKQIKGNP